MEIIKKFQDNLQINIKGTNEFPEFRASDIGFVLGIKDINSIIRDFDNTEKCMHTVHTLGGLQTVTFLTEKGLYQVLFTSRKPVAKQFKNWVCEVVRELRINGTYTLENKIKELEQDKKNLIKNVEDIQQENVIILNQKEQTLIDNFKNKSLVYFILINEKIGKFGIHGAGTTVCDFGTRLKRHKHEIGPYITLEYVFETPYNKQLEDAIKTCKKLKIINREYIGTTGIVKNQTELIQLSETCTINDVYRIILELKEKLNNAHILKENEDLKKENEELKIQKELNKKSYKLEKTDKKIVYIGHNPSTENIYKFGLRDQIEEDTKDFVYTFTFETKNGLFIESMVKIYLEPFKLSEVQELYTIKYIHLKYVVDFCIMSYENYQINDSVENLYHFMNKYNLNRLINSSKSRTTLPINIYKDFISENVIYGQTLKVSCGDICTDFYNWYSKKYPNTDYTHIKLENNQWSTNFQKEITKNISNITKIEYLDSISLSDKKRGLFYSNVAGFVGFELKSMSNKIVYFEKIIYEKYISEFIEITNNNKHKVSRKEILDDFIIWIKTNKYEPNSNIYAKKNLSPIFANDLIENVENITSIKLNKKICKLLDHGCFVGLNHKKFPFTAHVFEQKPEKTDSEKIKNIINRWTSETSAISNIFKKIAENGFSIEKEKIESVSSITSKRYNYNLIFDKNDTHYFIKEEAKNYLIKNPK